MKIRSVQTFGVPSIQDYYRSISEEIRQRVSGLLLQKINEGEPDLLEESLFQQYALPPLELDDSKDIELEKIVKQESFETIFGDEGHKDVTYARITLPLKPYPNTAESLKHHTQTHVLKVYEFDFDSQNSVLTVDILPENVDKEIEEYKTLFGARTNEINQSNAELKQHIKNTLEERRKKVAENDSAFESTMQNITTPLKRKGHSLE
ncbi:hypothetical protein HYS97_03030 [Candidatus Daviesbacteria bacterium]|nr:hypothetical protein [Candidatus Daviesbacteria bacterium]